MEVFKKNYERGPSHKERNWKKMSFLESHKKIIILMRQIHQRLRRAQEKGHFWILVNSQQEVSDHIHIITHF